MTRRQLEQKATAWAIGLIGLIRTCINEWTANDDGLTMAANDELAECSRAIKAIETGNLHWAEERDRFDTSTQTEGEILDAYLDWQELMTSPTIHHITNCVWYEIVDWNLESGVIYHAECSRYSKHFTSTGCAKCPDKELVDTEERAIEAMPYTANHDWDDIPF